MKVKLEGMIATRHHAKEVVAQYAETAPDVTEVDCSEADIIGASTMHQLIVSFPGATFTGLTGFDLEQYEWVLDTMRKIDERDKGEQS